MLSPELLKEKGYKEYRKTPFEHNGVEHVYQKCFCDDHGKKYFIDVKKWEDMCHPYTGDIIPGGYEYELQLYQKGTHNAINMLFFNSWELDAVETFVENMFQTGVLDYYELY